MFLSAVRTIYDLSRIRSPRGTSPWLIAAVLAGFCPIAHAFNVYTVGGDPACGFSTIQDAIDAAAGNPGEDYVWIANDQDYSGQAVVITDQDVIVEGGFTDCTQIEPTGQTLVDGTSGHSVFEIEGTSNVELGYLEIAGASMDDSHMGGGIYFGGDGSLTLVATWVHSNQTGSGGGIAMNPSLDGLATLYLDASTVSVNTATVEGGGIWLGGPTTMYSDSASYITTNSAPNGAGGGIKLASPAVAYISSSVNNNSAQYGGGIAAYSTNEGNVDVNLYSTDATNRVAIYGNTATQGGGGVYIQSSRDGTAANLCAQDFSFDANVAPIGAAIYANVDPNGGPGSNVFLNAFSCVPPSPPAPAVPCVTGPLCNEIADNISQDGGGNITNGGIVEVSEGGTLLGYRFAARRNNGGDVIFVDTEAAGGSSSDPLSTQIHDCLIVDNTASRYDVETYGAGVNTQLIVDSCTIANNFEGFAYSIGGGVNFAEVTNSIIYDPGANVIDFGGPGSGDLTAQYDLVNNASTVPGLGIDQGQPSFVDEAGGDYHLQRSSLGVDYAPSAGGVDLDGNPRTIDLNDIPNVFGPLDLGAYEIQTQAAGACSAADTIFCNGFDP